MIQIKDAIRPLAKPIVGINASRRTVKVDWTFRDLLTAMVNRGRHPAVVSMRVSSPSIDSYAELAANAGRLASGLIAAGLGPGEPVVILAPNSVAWITIRLAVGAAGALPVPLDDLGTQDEVAAQVQQSAARWAFASPAHVAALKTWLQPGSRIFLVGDDAATTDSTPSWRSLLAAESGPLPQVEPESPAVLVYTSGTTGAAKQFTLSYRNIWANVRALVEARVISQKDRVLLPLPLHHIYPQVVGLLTPLASGATIVLPEGGSGPQIIAGLTFGEATAVVGVPRLYGALANAMEQQIRARGRLVSVLFNRLLHLAIMSRRHLGFDLGRILFRRLRSRLGPRLRLLVSGGARIEPALLCRLVGLGFEVRSGYGLAETASIFTGNLPGNERLGSEGRPFTGGELRIAEPDGTGAGEIQLRGPNVISGYRNNPAADREAFTPDGWFRTGDIGRLDGGGYLTVTGRLKELIVLGGGKKVNPERLEEIYGASPVIREIAILEHGGTLVALVQPDLEAIRAAGLTRVEDALRIALQEKSGSLAPWERLTGFAVSPGPLPRTRLGKYRRFLLPSLYQEALSGLRRPPAALSPADEALLLAPRARAAWDLLRERYPERAGDLDASLALDLGLDSLEWMTLAIEIERRFSVALPEAMLAELQCVRDLVRLVAQADISLLPAPPAEADAWLHPPGWVGTLVAGILYGANRHLMRGLFRVRVAGSDGLPATGPFVIVANHCSDLDPLLIAAALPPGLLRRVHWGGEVTRLFANAWLRWFCRQLRIFPVDESLPGRTLRLAGTVLERGDGLVWFPEAWRSPDGQLQRFLPGIGHILSANRVPVIPARLFGTFEAMPRTHRWPRLLALRVRFGRPVNLRGVPQGPESPPRIAALLHDAVASLASIV